MGRNKKAKDPSDADGRLRFPVCAAIAVAVASVAVMLYLAQSGNDAPPSSGSPIVVPHDAGGSSPSVRVFRNGGGTEPVLSVTDVANWRRALLSAYPNASKVSIRDAEGMPVAHVEHACIDYDARCSDSAAAGLCNAKGKMKFLRHHCPFSCGSCGRKKQAMESDGELPRDGQPLYAVVDSYPFVWPPTPTERSVGVGFDGETRLLRTLSEAPRVFEAEGVASAEECAAIRRLAAPKMKSSAIFEGAEDEKARRKSATSWLSLDLHAEPSGDLALLQAVWLRIAALVRMDPRSAEMMQVIRYDVGQHYYYHVDNGGPRTPASVRDAAFEPGDLLYAAERTCTNVPARDVAARCSHIGASLLASLLPAGCRPCDHRLALPERRLHWRRDQLSSRGLSVRDARSR